MAKYTLDRFEGKKAVLLLKGNESVEKVLYREQLPADAKEGDILELEFQDDGQLKEGTILEKETEAARGEAKSLLEKLKKKNRED